MSFFLWTGVTPSCYKSSGNIPWSTQLLKTLTIKPAKTSLFILNTFVGMPSFWQALSNTQIVNYFSYCSIARVFFWNTVLNEKSSLYWCWSNIFVATDNGLLILFESTPLLFIKFGIFKLEMISGKKIIKGTKQFSIVWYIFTFFYQIHFSGFLSSFFEKKGSIIFQKNLLSLILLLSKSLKYDFLVDLKSF